jgi:hypothetical protein
VPNDVVATPSNPSRHEPNFAQPHLGEPVGVTTVFEHTPDAHTPLWPDVTRMHDVLGRTKVPWREGFRRMAAARHPELALDDPTR